MKFTIGTKKEMTQVYDSEGMVHPVTIIDTNNVKVVGFKTVEKDGYNAIVLGKGEKKKANKAETNKYKGLEFVPKAVFEFKVDEIDSNIKLGDECTLELEEGAKINVTGWTKGKGFAGVVKRWGFKGGPKTHGQSDRHRAAGSIGSGTTPGRVYKGKKMAGRMGGARQTTQNLKVVKNDNEEGLMFVEGAVPGAKSKYVLITSN